jgi:NAD kinase
MYKVNKVMVCGLAAEAIEIQKIAEKYFTIVKGIKEEPDIVILVGGDGTILEGIFKTMFSHTKIPILKVHHRINTQRSLGYTMDVNIENIDLAFDDVKNGHSFIQEHRLMEVIINGEKNYALNDVGISSDMPNKNVLLKIIIHGWEHSYLPTPKCTGVVISSAYGSSAWNLSLGGPLVVDEHQECLLLSLRESPLKPEHYLINPTHSIEIQTLTPINVTYDRDNTLLRKGNVLVRMSSKRLYMIRTMRTMETLTAKLIRFNKYQYEQLR